MSNVVEFQHRRNYDAILKLLNNREEDSIAHNLTLAEDSLDHVHRLLLAAQASHRLRYLKECPAITKAQMYLTLGWTELKQRKDDGA